MRPDTLILFDYSGTLSLSAVAFGRENPLREALEKSGLARLGVTPSRFWAEIVNPTWEEGSTTRVGYKEVMLRRLRDGAAGWNPGSPPVPDRELEKAVGDFVDSYLAASSMEERWRPLLKSLSSRPDACTVIATDHYAEATPAIVKFLADWDIPALPADGAFGAHRPPALVVANSADLGVHKDEPSFWQRLKTGLQLCPLRAVLLVDDFGFNEQAGDAYGERARVERRQQQTVRLLREVFSAPVHVFGFFLERPEDPQAREALAIQAALAIHRLLERKV